ncbi:MAG: hypothetical protein JWL69_1812, partial [Phycisphaerales bacterium]|nr:hypothetical protein [Phycisphaerales bacterium]
AATQAATKPAGGAEALAAERHKNADPRWIEFQRQQRNRARDHWPSVGPAATLKPGALVSIKMAGDQLQVKVMEMNPTSIVRINVEGSNAVWTFMRSRIGLVMPGPFGRQAPFTYINRFDFDTDEEQPWAYHLNCNDRTTSLSSQSIYGTVSLVATSGAVTLTVNEFTQWGQAAANVLSARAGSLPQLRADRPAEFRQYVLPLLEKFSDVSFLTPGPGDVYAVFTEIPADAKTSAQLEALLPELDADDPADRDAASARLAQLGAPGVLAALRLDPSGLSEEQKIRLRNFVGAHCRLGLHDPLATRKDAAFLADCLEFDDPAVRAAARTAIEKRLGHPIAFDTAMSGDAAARAADEIRKELTPPTPPPSTAPATQPEPQA